MTPDTDGTDRNPKKRKQPRHFHQTDVIGRWTHHAFKISHDKETVIVHLEEGVEIVQGKDSFTYTMNLRDHNPREFIFSPDNKQVAFWAPLDEENLHKRIALMDLTRLAPGEPKFKIIYDPGVETSAFGMEWSPAGDALFVIERAIEEGVSYTQIQRLAMPGAKARRIVRVAGVIDFFMPPVSRFESGQGDSKDPYQIIFGAEDGLYLTDPEGRRQRRISKVPAVGLHNIEWSPQPKRNLVVLFFRFPTRGPDGRRFRGVYLVDLDLMEKDPTDEEAFIEHLYDGVDVHTLWFSPKGTYVTWSSKEAAWFRKPESAYNEAVELSLKDEDDRYLELRGVSWNDEETKLAFTAENRVMVFDVERYFKELDEKKGDAPEGEGGAKKDEEEEPNPYEIARFPAGFAAEPVWIKDRVFLTVVEDITEERRKIRETPSLGTPTIKLDEKGKVVEPKDDDADADDRRRR